MNAWADTGPTSVRQGSPASRRFAAIANHRSKANASQACSAAFRPSQLAIRRLPFAAAGYEPGC
jgi:hypothetical protein